MFPLSLIGDAAIWSTKLPYNSICTWDQLRDLFLERYYQVSMKLNHKDELNKFVELGECVIIFKERFSTFIRGVPIHRIDD